MSDFSIFPIELLQHDLTALEMRLLIALYSFRGKNTNTVWPSREKLAKRANITDETTVSKVLGRLEKKGLLTKKKRGFGCSNVYELLVPETPIIDETPIVDDLSIVDKTSTVGNLQGFGSIVDDSSTIDDLSTPIVDVLSTSIVDDLSTSKELTNEQTNEHTNKNNIVQFVFNHWQTRMGKPRSKLDGKRRRIIETALKSYSTEDLILAIDGCAASPWHMGDNPQSTIYNGLDLIFRNADKIDQFIQLNSKTAIHGVIHATRERPVELNETEQERIRRLSKSASGRVTLNAERELAKLRAAAGQGADCSLVDDHDAAVRPPLDIVIQR